MVPCGEASSGAIYSGIALYRMSKNLKKQESEKVRRLSIELSKYKSQFDPELIESGSGFKRVASTKPAEKLYSSR
jgi:hypothetical protein